jgi:hypothetical protein
MGVLVGGISVHAPIRRLRQRDAERHVAARTARLVFFQIPEAHVSPQETGVIVAVQAFL